MSIKEAGRYSNFLKSSIYQLEALSMIGFESRIQETKIIHKRSKAKEGLEDIIETEPSVDLIKVEDTSLEDIDKIIDDLILEKVLLTDAINRAKEKILIDVNGFLGDHKLGLDAAIELSKSLRGKSDNFYLNLLRKEEGKFIGHETGYTFNIEGNQVAYIYETETKTKLLFSPDDYREENKKRLLLADGISESIDLFMTKALVDFKPKYSYLDSLDELIIKFKSKDL